MPAYPDTHRRTALLSTGLATSADPGQVLAKTDFVWDPSSDHAIIIAVNVAEKPISAYLDGGEEPVYTFDAEGLVIHRCTECGMPAGLHSIELRGDEIGSALDFAEVRIFGH